MNVSVKTIKSPEFINLQPSEISPLMSECEIKVLYIGENRNGSYITKDVATEMSKTLRGCPIVGYYQDIVGDFRDHGQRITIDVNGIQQECLTFPYGFVAPDADVWFQTFEDENKFGEKTEREYLMTTGYLWTSQFEECKIALEGEGKPQSMELDEATLDGSWETNKQGIDFFIINDATFSKLCILGDDIEPCFEGAKVSSPEVSINFTKIDTSFKNTLFSMMEDLKFALEGGNKVEENNTVIEPEVVEDAPAAVDSNDNEPAAAEVETVEEVFEDVFVYTQKQYDELQTQLNDLVSNYSALEERFNNLTKDYEALQETNEELTKFQKQIKDAEKDKMIESFSMLADEDKANVIANKDKYTVEEIEKELSVIYFRKNINFNLNKGDAQEQPAVTVTFDHMKSDPAWVTAVKNRKNKN